MGAVLTILLYSTLALAQAALSETTAAGPVVPRMTKERLGNIPDVYIIDIRVSGDWAASREQIAGARREDPDRVSAWADKYPRQKSLVLYCACPEESTSIRVAEQLIRLGFTRVHVLEGGWEGWLRAHLPTEPKAG